MKHLLVKTSNWKFILPALIGFIYCIFLFQEAQTKMSEIAGEEVLMIDVRNDYTLNEINDFFTKIKPEGRQIHRQATGVVDMIFPFAYGLFFILLSAYFLKKITYPESNWMWLALFPILLMLIDFKENWNTLHLLDTFPNLTNDMVDSAAKLTSIKAMFVNLSMGLPLVLSIIWMIQWLRNRNN